LLDETTYAASRQYGEFRANQRLAELKALGIPLGWLQIVLDDAEVLEHRYGHGVIDAAIAVASATLGRNIGSMDLLIRWDRTAFRLCVNSCTTAELQQLAGKLVALVRNSNVAWWGDPLPIAISIGGTIARPADQLSSLEARAKGALEHSRSAGGNQATIADSSGGTGLIRIL
jgi:GGDEF domain-containing protein